MNSQLRSLVIILSLLFPAFIFGQQATPMSTGVPGACGNVGPNLLSASSRGSGNQSPQNGTNTLGNIYSNTVCGLNYTQASQRLGKRFSPAGINQPAPFVIAGIPACAVIQKAYLWAEGSGNGAAQTATVAGPCGTASYPMSVVGNGPDKCWGYAGSYTYRADVTATVCGNGTYNISGILTNPPTAGNDMDGATLLVIWSDPSQTYQGTIILADGAMINTVVNGSVNYNMIYPAVCGPTTNAQAFCCVGDLQFNGSTITMNGTVGAYAWNWWNYIQVNTTVNSGQTNSNFNVFSPGDCYNLCVAGLYYRTTCVACSGLTLNMTSTPTTCSNCNGTATVTVVPAGAYTYSWSPSAQTGSTATNLCAGTYTVTVTGACSSSTATVVVASSVGGLTLSGTQNDVLCNGSCTGSEVSNVTGGTGPYTFTTTPATTNSTVGSSNTASNLCAGTYTINVTDANGCTGTRTVTITQPPPITLAMSAVQATCGNSNGSATVVASGGAGGYSYSWSPSGGNGPTASNLSANTYVVTVTDANGCIAAASIVVPNAAAPTATISSFTNVTCFGACDGTATCAPVGGTSPYTYAWAPSGGNGVVGVGLCPGTYTCTVTDANGCTTTASCTITQPPQLTATTTQVDVLCNGNTTGSATATAAGGTPGYGYLWTPSGQTTATATGLGAGNYSCAITDLNGCTITVNVTITEPTALTVSTAGFNVSCNGVCDGQIVAIPAGGTPNYSFAWSTGCTTPSCSNICAGTYNLTVTDLNGCTVAATATVTQPPAILITTTTADAHCNQSDGSATATFSGGTGTLSAVWTPGNIVGANLNNVPAGNYCVIVTDQNGCSDTVCVVINNIPGVVSSLVSVTPVSCFGGNDGQIICNANGGTGTYTYTWSCSPSTTSTASNLTAGTCTFTVTDQAGCIDTTVATVIQPTQLTASASSAPAAICAGQSSGIILVPAGGTPAYNVIWMPGNMVGPSQTVSPAVTTTYTGTVTDANGCTATATTTVTVNPMPSASLSGSILSGCVPLCVNFLDGSTVSAPGVISTWSWDFGDGSPVSTAQNPTHCYTVSGVYSVILTVTTTSGCTSTITMPNYINVFVNPVAAFGATPQPTTILDPWITFTDSSLNATSWLWSFGDLNNSTSTLQNPSFPYPDVDCYQVVLNVSTPNGCTDSTSKEVCIGPDVTLYVPNAFSPNGDGINDVFIPVGMGIDPEHYELWIFDRWGNLIFSTTDLAKGWDGKVQGGSDICQIDTYVWKIKALDMNSGKLNMIGRVSLIK